MKIKFSRHAKRRIKLYEIPESVIINILEGKIFSPGKQEIVENIPGFELPIKIVFNLYGNDLIVTTAYPLKRGRK